MKKYLFIIMLLVQSMIFFTIPLHHELVQSEGEHFQIVSETYPNHNQYELTNGPVYMNLQINYLADEQWDFPEELKWGTKVYVLLTPDEAGIYHASEVSLEKMRPNEDELMLIGQYHYYNEMDNNHYVEYGFERIDNMDDYEIDLTKQWKITLVQSSWGQTMVTNIENSE